MRARAALVAEVDSRGITRLTRIRSEPPLVLRATPGAVYVVGGAGGPLGGDQLTLDIEVGPGAALTVRSAAASVAQAGPGPSVVDVTASVAEGGRLDWLPEPVIAARGCRHHMTTVLSLAEDATALWREEIVLGRYGETPGSVVSRFRADLGGHPLLRHDVGLGPDHPHTGGPAVVGPARAFGSVLVVDPGWTTERPPARCIGPAAAILVLDGPAVQVIGVAADARELRRTLDDGAAACGHTARLAAT